MQQQHQIPLNSPSSTPIKPILLAYCREKKLDDLTALRSLIPHSRNLKKMRFYQPDTRYPPWNKTLRSFTNTLKTQNSLSELHYQLFGNLHFNTALFAKEFRGLSSLSSLKLEVREESINFTYVQAFMKTLASFKNLTHLDVRFSAFRVNRSPALEDLFKSLTKLPKLTNLSIHIHLGARAIGGELDLLVSCLSRLTKLQSLQLNIDKSLETNDKNLITILPSVLAQFTSLAHFELDLARKTIEAPALFSLFKFLGTMKTLSSISINVGWGNTINENNTEILPECLSYLDPSVIRKLNLTVPVGSLDKLPEALMRFSSLSVLYLSFCSRKVMTDENIMETSSMLSSLTSLESLNIAFNPLENDILFDSIVSGIASLQNLKFLRLYFGQLKTISGKQVQRLFESLKPSLKFLDISLSEPKSVVDVDESYEKLGENLKELVQLKDLSLDFGRNSIMKNAEIKSILTSVKKLQDLSSLILRLGNLENIDASAIEIMTESLRCLPSLSSVCLQLNRCNKLMEKEDSLLSLFSVLREKESIIDINLGLSSSKTNQEQTSELWKVKDINLAWC